MLIVSFFDPVFLLDGIGIVKSQLGNAFEDIEVVDWNLGIAKLTLHWGARKSPYPINALRWHGWQVLEEITTAT